MFDVNPEKTKKYLEEKSKEINIFMNSKLESERCVDLDNVLNILGFDASGTNQGWIKIGNEIIFED